MPKLCKDCGRPMGPPDHEGRVCNMAEIEGGRIVHASRLDPGGDLHGEKVVNRWIKKEDLKRT